MPLAGLRVVTLEHAVAAPLCSRHLADLGADVIKIERPGEGDLARSYDSVVNGLSAYFVWANRGKRSVVLDLRDDSDRQTLWQLIDHADVFVHNLGPGAVDRLGFTAAAVAERNPRLVNCAISGYGAGGPYEQRKAFDLLIQGEAGLLSVTGEGDDPAKVGISVADMCAAVYALSSILAALHTRNRSERGTFIDISLLDCLSEWMMAPTYHQLYADAQLPRAGAKHNMMVPYGVYPVGSGGHVNFAVQTEAQWRAFCTVALEEPALAEDVRFARNEDRVRNRRELEHLIEQHFASMNADEATALLEKAGIPYADVRDLRGLAEHPQLAARRRWFEIDSPNGPVRALRAPFNLHRAPERRSAVPGLGEHTDAVRRELAELAATGSLCMRRST
jgi:crotonobetainyl-CoA:carnitine CoA-transferase CaiB-like acyl-CoA transferase